MADVNNISWVVARDKDGGVQITFTIPWNVISLEKVKALTKLGKDMTISGFRKGNAPIAKIEEKVDKNNLVNEILQTIIPKALSEAINKDNIKLVIYPKFELLKSDEGSDWQLKALTCEIPNFDLGDYKKIISGELRAQTIWTPNDKDGKDKKKPTKEELQEKLIPILTEKFDVKIPSMLIEEEVNSRLSQLLDRIEKLGLSLENYLKSIGKTTDSIRDDYKKEAEKALRFELILNHIADMEKMTVTDTELEEALKAYTSAENKEATDDMKRYVKGVLLRRKALDWLVGLQ